MNNESRPNDRQVRLFCASPSPFWDGWRFIVEYPDYDWVEGALSSVDASEILGECVTPPVLPFPCFWDRK